MRSIRSFFVCSFAILASVVLFHGSSFASILSEQIHVSSPVAYAYHVVDHIAVLPAVDVTVAVKREADFKVIAWAAPAPLKPEYAESYATDGATFIRPHLRC